jgi:1,4-dihydroxy-2-naphthoyl-CoA synthase
MEVWWLYLKAKWLSKKAREIFFQDEITLREAIEMGMVNDAIPHLLI